ncbi:MAG: formylglycine-generating enzyme family protein [Proteobacteria bacterium]|nr:formylglycine-generating enzyme family protein [Pseudomonadota bacterium]
MRCVASWICTTLLCVQCDTPGMAGKPDLIKTATNEAKQGQSLRLTQGEQPEARPLPGLPGAVLVWIPPGSFVMGAPDTEPGRDRDEGPTTRVTLTRGFWMWRTEVTEAQTKAVLGTPASFGACGRFCPALGGLSLAMEFANALSQRYGLATCYARNGDSSCDWEVRSSCLNPRYRGNSGQDYYRCPGFRLPTEAEWEYAARAGTQTAFYNGKITQPDESTGRSDPRADAIGWYCFNARAGHRGCYRFKQADWHEETDPDGAGFHPVAQKRPNPWGLYDMAGNAWETVWDGHHSELWGGIQTDPVRNDGYYETYRGGAYTSDARGLRSANRYFGVPKTAIHGIGFRLVVSAP